MGFSSVRYLPKLLARAWRTRPRLAVAIALLRAARAASPVTLLWIGKLITDEIVHAVTAQADVQRLEQLIGLEIGLVVVSDALGRLSMYSESLLADLFTGLLPVSGVTE